VAIRVATLLLWRKRAWHGFPIHRHADSRTWTQIAILGHNVKTLIHRRHSYCYRVRAMASATTRQSTRRTSTVVEATTRR
jgi:hypothetical protein